VLRALVEHLPEVLQAVNVWRAYLVRRGYRDIGWEFDPAAQDLITHVRLDHYDQPLAAFNERQVQNLFRACASCVVGRP